jgi:hypothetical protein
MENTTRFDLNFYERDTDHRDVRTFSMGFENGEHDNLTSETVARNVQTFLNSVGFENIEVIVATAKEDYVIQPIDLSGYNFDSMDSSGIMAGAGEDRISIGSIDKY